MRNFNISFGLFFLLILCGLFPVFSSSKTPRCDRWERCVENSDEKTHGNRNLEQDSQGGDFDQIKEVFLKGEFPNYSFDTEKMASQALKAECPDQYNKVLGILSHNRRYFYGSPDGGQKLESGLERGLVRTFRSEIGECGKKLFEEYYTEIHGKIRNRNLHLIQTYFVKYGLSSSEYEYPPLLKEFKDKVSKGVKDIDPAFVTDCMEKVTEPNKLDKDELSAKIIKSSYKTWKEDFEGLYQKNCQERSKELKSLLNRLVERIKQIRTSCQIEDDRNSCIADLKRKVSLVPTRSNMGKEEKIFFPICLEKNRIDTQNCCSESSLKDCSEYDQFQNKYQEALSQNKGQCSGENPNLQHLKQDLSGSLQSLCQQSSKTCQEECEEELKGFKNKFLECFFLPNWNPEANYWAKIPDGGKSCSTQIQKIIEAYNARTRPNNLSQSSIGSDIFDCEAPRRSLEARIREDQRLASQALQDLCQEQGQASGTAAAGPVVLNSQKVPSSSSNGHSRRGSSGSLDTSLRIPDQRTGAPLNPDTNFFNTDAIKNNVDSTNLIAAELEKNNSNKNKFFNNELKDEEGFGKSKNYEDQFDPLLRGKGSSQSASSDFASLDGGLSGDSFLQEFSSSSKRSQYRRREIASYSAQDSNSAFESSGPIFNSSPQENYLASIGRKFRKTLSSAFSPVKVPTVQSTFNIHKEEVNLLEQQKKLFEMFCQSRSCNFDNP